MIRSLMCAAVLVAAASAASAQTTVKEVEIRAPGAAGPGVEVKHEAVKYSDLNLRRPHDTNVLFERISIAADRVCSPAPRNLQNVSDSANHKTCVDKAINGAVVAINDPHLKARWKATRK